MRRVAPALSLGAFAAALAAAAPGPAAAPRNLGEEWGRLIDAKEFGKARTLCSAWLKESDRSVLAEARKCLANVELSRAETPQGYKGQGVDKALEHLNAGVKAAPDDLSIHQSRLFVLLNAGRMQKMPAAVAESAGLYRGPDALEAWLAYCPEFERRGKPEAGFAYAKELERAYPKDPRTQAACRAARRGK